MTEAATTEATTEATTTEATTTEVPSTEAPSSTKVSSAKAPGNPPLPLSSSSSSSVTTVAPELNAEDRTYLLNEERDEEKKDLKRLKRLLKKEKRCSDDKCRDRILAKREKILKKAKKRKDALRTIVGNAVLKEEERSKRENVKKMLDLKEKESECGEDKDCLEKVKAQEDKLYKQDGSDDDE